MRFQDFVRNLKEVPKQFGLNFTSETSEILYCLEDDDHDEINEELYKLFPNLKEERNLSYSLSIVH